MDEEFGRAIAIGQRNAQVIPLIENWCAHARIMIEGGVGLLEQETGLPIASRRVTCEHERASGQVSMHLAENALDFHDRNCITCTQRVPVRLPNLSTLLGEREARRVATAAAAATRAKAFDRALGERAQAVARARQAVRDAVLARQLAESTAYAVTSVLDLLLAFDASPSDATASPLLESARAVPEAFTSAVESLALLIADAGGGERTATMLALINSIAPQSRGLFELSLRAMGRGEAVSVASAHIERLAATLISPDGHDDTLIMNAMPSAIWRSRAYREIMRMPQRPEPGVYLALQGVAPRITEVATRRALRDKSKHFRRAGAYAVHALIAKGALDAALTHLSDLLAGFALPDDHYEEGEAANAIAWVLGELLIAHPAAVQPALEQAAAQGNARDRLGVLRTYISVFDHYDDFGHRRRGFREPQTTEGASRAEAERLSLRFIVDVLTRLPDDHDLLRTAVEFFAESQHRVPSDLLASTAAPLLGVVALAVAEFDDERGEFVVLEDPRSLVQRQMERMARRSLLDLVITRALDAVLDLARDHPDPRTRAETVAALLDTLARLPETSESLRARLVAVLGSLVSDPASATPILPLVYTAMTSRSNLVRARSAAAYTDLVKRLGADNLPTLLHESFLVLLGDPYIIVHDAALRSLDDVELPTAHQSAARLGVWRILVAHKGGTSSSTLALAIRVLLALTREAGGPSENLRAEIVQLLGTLEPYLADDFVRRGRGGLRGASGYGELVLSLLANPKTFDTAYEDLLEELATLPHSEILRLADHVVAAALSLMERQYWRVFACLRVLIEAGAYEATTKLARAAVDACGATRARRPRRLSMERVEATLGLEASASRGDIVGVRSAVARIREAERAIETDRAENEEVRGFRFPS